MASWGCGQCRCHRTEPWSRHVISEWAFDHFCVTRTYLKTHGKPVAFSSDKHCIFRVNNGEGGERVTQFSHALSALTIDIICANSPHAKGRVKHAFANSIEAIPASGTSFTIWFFNVPNAWVPGFMASSNAWSDREPGSTKDLHRKLSAADNLDEILTWRKERTVTYNLTRTTTA